MKTLSFQARALLILSLATAIGMSANAKADYKTEIIAEGLDYPWSIAFLPGGDRLVTELTGNLRRLSAAGELSDPITGVPAVYRAGQGGLFDVLPHPDFEQNGLIYLSFAAGEPDSNGTTVVRATLTDTGLQNVQTIFSVAPKKYAPLHYGGRIAWLPDGTLLLTTGDGFDFRDEAQNQQNQMGKTIRMNDDGTPPADNPFPNAPYVWSYGHRNPQGLAVGDDGTVYQHEHGPQGGDEVNILESGVNYGWPAITYGMDYNGAYVSPFTEYPGMAQPAHQWTPSIAPSGLMVYQGDMFPQWQGNLFAGALVDKEVRRLELNDDKVTNEQPLFNELGERIRDIREAPDGSIYILTDGPSGQVVRISAQ